MEQRAAFELLPRLPLPLPLPLPPRRLRLLRLPLLLLLLLHLCPPSLRFDEHRRITPCLATTCFAPNASELAPCPALLTFFPTSNIKLSDMAARFSIANASALLGPNRFNLSIPDLPDVVLPKSYPFKIAIAACACRSLLLPGLGTRVATSVNYTVVSGDTLSHIADELYSGLITYQAIANVSGVVNVDQIFPNQSLSIPIPCACPEDAVLPAPSLPSAAEILSYQVQAGDNLSAIASSYNSSLQAIQSFNPNVSDSSLQQKQILFVPLSVCKPNFSSGAVDGDLQVLEGAYALTANDCVQCNCQNGTLYCFSSNFSSASTCGSQTCTNSTLKLGDFVTSQNASGCSVTSCIYTGYNASTIFSRLEATFEKQCPSFPSKELAEGVYNPPSGLELPSSSSSPPPTESSPNSSPPSPQGSSSPSPPSSAPLSTLSISSWFSFHSSIALGLACSAPFLLV